MGEHRPPPNFTPNKFQDRSSGACRIQESLLAAGLCPGHRWGELTALPQTRTLAGGEEASFSIPTPLSAL